MPKYRFRFVRIVRSKDSFERVIESPSWAEAEAAAAILADESNRDCPDDCAPDPDWVQCDAFYARPVSSAKDQDDG